MTKGENWPAIKTLEGEIDIILEQEDIKWKQQAKQSWYDQHPIFFMLGQIIGRELTRLQKSEMKREGNGKNKMILERLFQHISSGCSQLEKWLGKMNVLLV
jgi:hypothetical protein